MVALPFIFMTNEYHVLSSHTLQSGQPPSVIQITKRFLKTQIEEIKKDFEDAKSLGAATAEEWLKGLEERGKEKRYDGARWERWENSGGLLSMGISRPSAVEASTIAKKEPIVKIETSISDGLNSVNRYQLANPLPSRNFPPFPAGRPVQSVQTSLRKFSSLCCNIVIAIVGCCVGFESEHVTFCVATRSYQLLDTSLMLFFMHVLIHLSIEALDAMNSVFLSPAQASYTGNISND
jgi:hypothetical protein